MTYSIVALDPDTGELGVAVQTAWPAVGAIVPWVEAGVGAVATQAFTNIALGPESLARMRAGRPADDVLAEVLAGDARGAVRQVGVVDASGRPAAHTGARCVPLAGHACAPGVSVQANMMERAGVWHRMLDAFHEGSGDLADRLLAALRAAEDAGGDLRGRQSAALLIAPGSPGTPPWARRYDLRIDRSAQPVEELVRLLTVARAYEALEAAIDAAEAGEYETALAGTASALRAVPHDPEVGFWHGVILFASGRAGEGRPVLQAALAAEPRLQAFGQRFAAAGHAGLLDAALRYLGVAAGITPPAEPSADLGAD